ncbi:MAG TPA: LOG family protein [Elusimicrobiota bacterium]|nr:LOG family protein [Elusimicrobiota bacterium]
MTTVDVAQLEGDVVVLEKRGAPGNKLASPPAAVPVVSALHVGTLVRWTRYLSSAHWKGVPFVGAVRDLLAQMPEVDRATKAGLLRWMRRAARGSSAEVLKEAGRYAPLLSAVLGDYLERFVLRPMDAGSPEALPYRPTVAALEREAAIRLEGLAQQGLEGMVSPGKRVIVRVSRAEGLLKNRDLAMAAVFKPQPDGSAVLYVHQRFMDALMAQDGRKRDELVRALVERELSLQQLLMQGHGFDEAHQKISENPTQIQLIDFMKALVGVRLPVALEAASAEAMRFKPVKEALEVEAVKQLKALSDRGIEGVVAPEKRLWVKIFQETPASLRGAFFPVAESDGSVTLYIHQGLMENLMSQSGRQLDDRVKLIVEHALAIQQLLNEGSTLSEAQALLATDPPAAVYTREPPAASSADPRLIGRELRVELLKLKELQEASPSAGTIFGGNRISRDSYDYQMAVLLGKKMYQRGIVPRTGGGPGWMEAVLKGYKEARDADIAAGKKPVVAHKTQGFKKPFVGQPLNDYVEVSAFFDQLVTRKMSLIGNSDGLLTAPGGYGTFDEIFDAWRAGRPQVLLGREWEPLIEALYRSWEKFGLLDDNLRKFRPLVVDLTEEGLDQALDYVLSAPRSEEPDLKDLPVKEVDRRGREIEKLLERYADWPPSIKVLGSRDIDLTKTPIGMASFIARWAADNGMPLQVGGPGPVTRLLGAVLRGVGKNDLLQGIFLNKEMDPVEVDRYFSPDRLIKTDNSIVQKMFQVENARAYVVFPGKLGTLDVLSELLPQMQMGIISERPIVLVGRAFWQPIKDEIVKMMGPRGLLLAGKEDLLQIVDTEEELQDILDTLKPKTPAQMKEEFLARQEELGRWLEEVSPSAAPAGVSPWWEEIVSVDDAGMGDVPRLLRQIFSDFYWIKVAAAARLSVLMESPDFPRGAEWESLLSGFSPSQREELREWMDLLRTRSKAIAERAEEISKGEQELLASKLRAAGESVSMEQLQGLLREVQAWGVEQRERFIGGFEADGGLARRLAGWAKIEVGRKDNAFRIGPTFGDAVPLRSIFWWQAVLDAAKWRGRFSGVTAAARRDQVYQYLSDISVMETRIEEYQQAKEQGADVLRLAARAANDAENPSEKMRVGSVIVSAAGKVVGAGFNEAPAASGADFRHSGGDPRQKQFMPQDPEEYQRFYRSRYDWRRSPCAEKKAVLNALLRGHSLEGATLYTNLYPCQHCSVFLQGTGIKTIVSPEYTDKEPSGEVIQAGLRHLHAPAAFDSIPNDASRVLEARAEGEYMVDQQFVTMLRDLGASDAGHLPTAALVQTFASNPSLTKLVRFFALRPAPSRPAVPPAPSAPLISRRAVLKGLGGGLVALAAFSPLELLAKALNDPAALVRAAVKDGNLGAAYQKLSPYLADENIVHELIRVLVEKGDVDARRAASYVLTQLPKRTAAVVLGYVRAMGDHEIALNAPLSIYAREAIEKNPELLPAVVEEGTRLGYLRGVFNLLMEVDPAKARTWFNARYGDRFPLVQRLLGRFQENGGFQNPSAVELAAWKKEAADFLNGELKGASPPGKVLGGADGLFAVTNLLLAILLVQQERFALPPMAFSLPTCPRCSSTHPPQKLASSGCSKSTGNGDRTAWSWRDRSFTT